jgi:RimJ/RimL family protein N-acetyltransferase
MLPVLSNDAITLRPWRVGDAADLQREVQDPEIVKWMAIELPYSMDDAELFIAGTEKAWTDREAAQFVICEDDDFRGYLGVLSVEDRMKVVEIGYWIAKAWRGRGIATEALRLALEWIREEIGPERIELGMISGNDASRAVAEKCGFRLDRKVPSRVEGKAEWIFELELGE